MTRYVDEVAALAGAYRTARELMGNEATPFELARQCQDDLWRSRRPDHVDRATSPCRCAPPWRRGAPGAFGIAES